MPRIDLPHMGLGCLELTRNNNRIIDYAIQKGITLFDTSDCYGKDHESEIALGEKLQHYPREKLIICTKGSVSFTLQGVQVCGKPSYLQSACEASLERLKTNHIDLYFLHRTDPKTPIETSIEALSKLVEQGKIKHIGLSEVTATQIRRANKIHPISAVQIEYSPWARQDEINGVINICQEFDIALIAYSPLGRAFFTNRKEDFFIALQNDYRNLLPRYNGELLHHNLHQREPLEEFAKKLNCSIPQLTLAWEKYKGFITIPTTSNPQHLDENLTALTLEITEQDMIKFEQIIADMHIMGERYPSAEVSAIYPEAPSIARSRLGLLSPKFPFETIQEQKENNKFNLRQTI